LIAEVLLNLIENAVKYSDLGSVIDVTSQEVDNQVRIEVSDTGGGIPEDEILRSSTNFIAVRRKNTKGHGDGLGTLLG